MVVSRKQFTPKKPSQAGGTRKNFSSCGTRKTEQAGGSRKSKKQTETMHEKCVGCSREGRKQKVRIDDVRKETFKGKGDALRARLVGKCEYGHKWYRFTKL